MERKGNESRRQGGRIGRKQRKGKGRNEKPQGMKEGECTDFWSPFVQCGQEGFM